MRRGGGGASGAVERECRIAGIEWRYSEVVVDAIGYNIDEDIELQYCGNVQLWSVKERKGVGGAGDMDGMGDGRGRASLGLIKIWRTGWRISRLGTCEATTLISHFYQVGKEGQKNNERVWCMQ